MFVTLTVARYSPFLGWAGFLSMAVFRLPLLLSKKITFSKLLGCGKNGTFDKTPDLRQWCILCVFENINEQTRPSQNANAKDNHNSFIQSIYGSFIAKWWKIFGCETWTILLDPIEGHGTWDGKKVFGNLPKSTDHQAVTAVLTRATIRLNKLNSFWKNVDAAAKDMAGAPGFIASLGVGEVPWIKQATFSLWQNKTFMKDFAYKMRSHAEIIKKTRAENWYKEDMFTRFKIVTTFGTLNGKDPMQGFL